MHNFSVKKHGKAFFFFLFIKKMLSQRKDSKAGGAVVSHLCRPCIFFSRETMEATEKINEHAP